MLDAMARDVTSAKWFGWHGNLHRAEQLLGHLDFEIYSCADNDARTKSEK